MSAVGHLHHFLCADVSVLGIWVIDSHDADGVGVLDGVFVVCLQHERCIAPQDLELVVHAEVILQLFVDVRQLEKLEIKDDSKPPIVSVES